MPFVARARRIVIYSMSHDRRTFVEHVDFISGPGFVNGHAGLPGGGPSLIVTPLCTMDFDPDTHRARLATLHPGVTLERVLDVTGFAPVLPVKVETTPPPTPVELSILRRMDPTGLLR